MTILFLLALLSPTSPAPRAAQARIDTLRALEVRRGDELHIEVRSSNVTIRTAAADSVQLRSPWTGSFMRDGRRISLHSTAGRAGGTGEELNLDIPAWLPMSVTTMSGDVRVTAGSGRVVVETLDGSIRVTGAHGGAKLDAVSGDIQLQDAKGRIELESVNGGIQVQQISGTLRAETVNGDITLGAVQSDDVSAVSVNGGVRFAGSLAAAGAYRFVTHNGDVTLHLSGTPNGLIDVSTFNGRFTSDFPLTTRGGRAATYTAALGTGTGARVTIESFQGSISLTAKPMRMPASAVR